MSIAFNFKSLGFLVCCSIFLAVFGLVHAGEPRAMEGWGLDSPYNQLYNPNEMDKFNAVVDDIIEVVPMAGMAPATALVVRESKDETVLVHVCPKWYLNTNDLGIKKGDKVKISGAWVEINGKDVFIAAKIKKGDYFELKVRLTRSGKPFWTMDPEELAKEKTSK